MTAKSIRVPTLSASYAFDFYKLSCGGYEDFVKQSLQSIRTNPLSPSIQLIARTLCRRLHFLDMRDSRLPKTLFAAFILAALAEAIRDFSLLPDRLASHFTASGFPNNWLEKPQFFALYAGLLLLATAITFLSPTLISITPTWAVNLPNKQYWLSPAHREDTLLYLDRYFAWSGLLLLIFEVCTMHLVFQANLQAVPDLPAGTVFSLLAVFILLSAGSTITLVRHFSRSPESS